MTASAGERFTAALRDYRNDGLLNARIIGVNTYTKGKMQNIIPLGDGSAVILTTGKFNPPCGINFDGVGITPDIVIPFDADGETDNQMDAAIAEITSMINSK
jgi:carboxyl-terminal processing protease